MLHFRVQDVSQTNISEEVKKGPQKSDCDWMSKFENALGHHERAEEKEKEETPETDEKEQQTSSKAESKWKKHKEEN